MGRSNVVGRVKHTQTYDSSVQWKWAVICYFNHHWLILEIPLVTSKAGVEFESIREHRSFSHYFLLWISKNPNMKGKIWTNLGKSEHKRNPGRTLEQVQKSERVRLKSEQLRPLDKCTAVNPDCPIVGGRSVGSWRHLSPDGSCSLHVSYPHSLSWTEGRQAFHLMALIVVFLRHIHAALFPVFDSFFVDCCCSMGCSWVSFVFGRIVCCFRDIATLRVYCHSQGV